MAVGEFVLARGDGFEIQTRQEAIGSNASANTATVMKIGDDVVGIYAKQAKHLVINGATVDLAVGESLALDGGGSVYHASFGDNVSFAVYVVTDAAGNGFWVNVYGGMNHLRPFVADGATGVQGLLGNSNGSPGDDLRLPNGMVIPQPIAAQALYGAFADAWRVTDASSLFIYGEGQSTASFTDRSYPAYSVTIADLTPEQRAAGEAAALAAGLVPGTTEFDNAVLDVGLTGNPAFAQAIAATPDLPQPQEPLVVQRAPTVLGEAAQTDEDTPILIGDVLANDVDPEGDTLILTGAVDQHGGVVQIIGGDLRFTPAPNFSGETRITYTVEDGAGNAVDGLVTVTVNPVADAPVLTGPQAVLPRAIGGTITLTQASLLTGFTDPDGDALHVEAVTAQPGSVVDRGDGTWTITIPPGHAGAVAIDYRVVDATGLSIPATLALPTNAAPQANGLSLTTALGQAVAVEVGTLLSGASDPDGDALAVLSVGQPGHGAVTINPDGSVSYSPYGGYAGADSFSYRLTDNKGGEATVNVAVTVTGVAPARLDLGAATMGQIVDLSGGAATHGVVGSAFDDRMTGGDGADTLSGGKGVDHLVGGQGADILNGGDGGDLMEGGSGNDSYMVDSLDDRVVELPDGGLDTVRTNLAAYGLGENLENLVFAGAGDFVGAGNNLDNAIKGGAGNDHLTGGEGNDVLSGGGGANLMEGGAGNDSYNVDSAGDQVVELLDDGLDLVRTTLAAYGLGENVENLMFGGAGDFTGVGNSLNNSIKGGVGNDRLSGGDGADILTGGNGDDVLIGGDGADILAGGPGSDTFVLDGAGSFVARDTISDYVSGTDRIELRQAGFGILLADPFGHVAGDQFVAGKSAATSGQHLIYDGDKGALYYDIDGAGGVTQVQIATFANRPVLAAADFWLT